MPDSSPALFVLLAGTPFAWSVSHFLSCPFALLSAALFDVRNPLPPDAAVALFVVRGYLVGGSSPETWFALDGRTSLLPYGRCRIVNCATAPPVRDPVNG